MQSRKIELNEIEDMKISNLPTRPTASVALGGKGYTASEMKEAFDKLPLFIFEKLNLLIEDLTKEGDESYVGSHPTGIREGHTLAELLADILSGSFAEYLMINGTPLSEVLFTLRDNIDELYQLVENLS